MKTNSQFRGFLEVALKLHQIFALVDVDYAKVLDCTLKSPRTVSNLTAHYREIVDSLIAKNGLDYVPRERSS